LFNQLSTRKLCFPRSHMFPNVVPPPSAADLHGAVVDLLEETVEDGVAPRLRVIAFLCAVLDATAGDRMRTAVPNDSRLASAFWAAVAAASDEDIEGTEAWPFRSREIPRRLFTTDVSHAGLTVLSKIYQLDACGMMWPGSDVDEHFQLVRRVELNRATQQNHLFGRVNKSGFLEFLAGLGTIVADDDGSVQCIKCGKISNADEADRIPSHPKFACKTCRAVQALPPPAALITVAADVAPSAECLVQLYVCAFDRHHLLEVISHCIASLFSHCDLLLRFHLRHVVCGSIRARHRLQLLRAPRRCTRVRSLTHLNPYAAVRYLRCNERHPMRVEVFRRLEGRFIRAAPVSQLRETVAAARGTQMSCAVLTAVYSDLKSRF
jgi:hypothetical protein